MRYHSYFGGRGLTIEKLTEGARKIAGVAEAEAEAELGR